MIQLGIADELVSAVTPERVVEAAWQLTNSNTRRNALIAARSVFGFKLKIPKPIPRRYDLPDEDTLRLALLTTPHETRALLMMYCALRLGEASAVTRNDLSGDRLRIDKQISGMRVPGQPTVNRLAEPKTAAADVVIPHWLIPRVEGLTETVKPDPLRESIRRAGARVGIHLNPHQLRAWAITTMIERGVPLALVQKQARHCELSVTLAYYQEYKDAVIHDVFG
jgi:integrase